MRRTRNRVYNFEVTQGYRLVLVVGIVADLDSGCDIFDYLCNLHIQGLGGEYEKYF